MKCRQPPLTNPAGRVALVTECPRHRVSDRRRPRRAGSGRRSRRHRRPERDDKLIADTGGPAVPARLDISDPSSIEAVRGPVADELGRVDILVNNAAIFEAATWDDLDFDLCQRIMAVNLSGPMLMCKAFLPLMRGQGWGRVINVASATVAIASPVSIASSQTSRAGRSCCSSSDSVDPDRWWEARSSRGSPGSGSSG
jgi:NAD(P)-dependent dehydrogenase (short-subunit alcohol dehydrogenase family)